MSSISPHLCIYLEFVQHGLNRAAQYACTLIGYTLQRGGASADLHQTVRQLEAHISLTRKREWTMFQQQDHACVSRVCVCVSVLRLGNWLEALEAAQRAIHLSDGVLRLCLTLGHLNRVMYFTCDNILWAGKTGVVPQLDQNKWSQRSFR